MRLSRSAILRGAGTAAVVYFGALGLWQVAQPFYMQALAIGLAALDLAGALPVSGQSIVVPSEGLLVLGAGVQPLAIPQRIIGADLALAIALISATLRLPWWRRAPRLVAAVGLVFIAHLATIAGQRWVTTTTSTSAWAMWSFWTTLYQGKVVPIASWLAVIGSSRRIGQWPSSRDVRAVLSTEREAVRADA